MTKSAKTIFVIIFSAVLFFGMAGLALAQPSGSPVDVFGGLQTQTQDATGLGSADPRIIAANIIRVVLGLLGIIALGLILYGGWLWMTSAGDASKVERAKKLLLNAVIGLAIILSAFGIVTFILDRLLSATGAVSGPPCVDGTTQSCGCLSAGSQLCTGGVWGPCSVGVCPSGGGPGGTPCDSNTLTPACDPDNTMCSTSQFCNTSSCLCVPTGGFGDPCSASSTPGVCIPDNARCSTYLQCSDAASPNPCVCEGAPVIEWLSPVDAGGTPNGAVGNFITIGGRYFGTTTGQVYFSDATGSTTVLAQFPNTVNANCNNNWTQTQVIVVVPPGAQDGPIRLVRGTDAQEDETANGRGPDIDDFDVNTTVRPGLCLASPAIGSYSASSTLEGANFAGALRNVWFGSPAASTSAINVGGWTGQSVEAGVPNLAVGATTLFVTVDGEASNGLRFTVTFDPNNSPVIDYLEPAQGPIGQYVTVYGRNFKSFLAGASQVYFGTTPADIDLPAQCQDSWWRDTYIIVKVPSGLPTLATSPVTATNRDGFTSNGVDFYVTVGTPGPGLCKLAPHNGPAGTTVSLYGDRFGSTAGTVRFYNNQTVSGTSWLNQSAQASVPPGAETGPVRIITNGGDVSLNSLPFTIGKCGGPADCLGGEECCTGGSFDGICRPTGSCGAGTANACTYGWQFSTGGPTVTPPTCAGYSDAAACVSAASCPNTPGQCQTNTSAVTGECGDNYCNSNNPICAGGCDYNSTLNRCVLTGSSCDMTDDTLVTGHTAECRRVGAAGRWQIASGGASCPLGTYRDTNGWCSVGSPGSPLACDICGNGFVCQANECIINRSVCQAGSSCDTTAGSPTENQCLLGNATCECCCRVNNSAQDCCQGLTCQAGGCGNDPINYGLCAGCRVELDADLGTVTIAEQDASDQACNCTAGSPTRYCDLTDLVTYPTGVCRDNGGLGALCNDGGACTTGGSCLAGLFCDPASACTCQPIVPIDCDASAAPGCQIDPTPCIAAGPGLFCDPAAGCTCQPVVSTTTAESRCQDPTAPAPLVCDTGVTDCGTDYQCLNEPSVDCRCCCNPGDVNAAGLTCYADKGACTGATRGLYCGCVDDAECGSPTTIGCAPKDTCCHDRPTVVSEEPADGATDVCRNPLISATFDIAMDAKTFTGNLIVLGNYGADPCPAGTQYLANGSYKKYSRLGKLWFRLRGWFNQAANAQASNFCAVTGLVKGFNNTSNQGEINFSPGSVLDADRQYFAIIKGDDPATASSSEGVKSRDGVAMYGSDTQTFNGVTFQGRIWSFTTKPANAVSSGICTLDYVVVEPTSYLFQTIENDPADDTNFALDNTTFDSDKLFYSFAKTGSGAMIAQVPEYDWTWDWSSENTGVATIATTSNPLGNEAIATAQNTKDGKTYLDIAARITVDSINSPSQVGQSRQTKASIYVFLCANPWPPVINPANWPWQDSAGNCDFNIASCGSQNFELYYCRDSASVGSANDLPAILSDPVIRGSAVNQPLKELFFFRENIPTSTLLTVTDQLDGSRVYADWLAVAGANRYKLYYGTASRNYASVVETTATNAFVSGLTRGTRYYFAVTGLVSSTTAESAYSPEASVIPTDLLPPAAPAGLIASSSAGAVDLAWTIIAGSDTVGYRVHYGANPVTLGAQENVGLTDRVRINGLTAGTTYYFSVGAYDAAGNEATTTQVSAIPD